MTNPRQTSADVGSSHIVDPPIIDFLQWDCAKAAFDITFVPSEDLSHESVESVGISEDSPEGRQISVWLGELSDLLDGGNQIVRIAHGGGGDFAFHFQQGDVRDLSDESLDQTVTQRVYDALQYIAQVAEVHLRMVGIKKREPLLGVRDVTVASNIAVRRVTLRNADRSNSLLERLIRELTIAIRRAPKSIIVVDSEGRNFCSGLDLWELRSALNTEQSPARLLRPLVGLFTTLAKHRRPIATLVRGRAVAGGVGLACCADVVIAHRDAEFRIPGEQGYRSLARVLIPILNQRRNADKDAINEWFGEIFPMGKATGWQLVDAICESEDNEDMFDLAIAKLQSTGLLARKEPIASRLPPDRIQEMEDAVTEALTSTAVAAARKEVEEWAKGRTPPS